MPRILITGADSFVGRNIIEFSRYKKIDEVSLFNINPEDIDFSNYDVVIHLVAIVHQSTDILEKEYFRINRDLCLNVASCAKKAGIKQFIFLSTVKVYGKYTQESQPWSESSSCNPIDSYGKSKYEAEMNLMTLNSENFIVSILRTPLVYGKGVKANMLSIMKLVDTFPILPLAKINNKRFFTSAENLVAFIDRIIEKNANGVFIAMDAAPLSTTELVYYISKYLGKNVTLFKMPNFIIKIGIYFMPTIFDRLFGSFEMENSLTLQKLDFKPPFLTEDGIKAMVQTYTNGKLRKRTGE